MNSQRGVGVILALMFLLFLSVLGSALLATTTIDIWISDNYNTGTQSLYLAEAGIEQAREMIRTFSSAEIAAVLASEDQPLIPDETLIDATGRTAGRYQVWMRKGSNDQVLTLLSSGRVGNSRKLIEVTIKKAMFPQLPGALVLDGPVEMFDTANATNFTIEPFVANPEIDMEPLLKTVSGLENLVAGITANATDVYSPGFGGAQTINGAGGPADYKVAVVNGDVNLGFGAGYGILLVRGNLIVTENFTWNGLVLVIGQGVIHWNNRAYGSVNGVMLLARTRANDRSPGNSLGTLIANRGGITADFNGAGGTIHYDQSQISAAHRVFPYVPIAVRER